MTQHRDSARETVLTAYQELLIEPHGLGSSLDEVARRAGLTKGGLLYHFGSRAALEEALIQRLEMLAEAEYERMSASPGGASAYYVELAGYLHSPLDRATLSVGALAVQNSRARDLLAEMRERYWQLLSDDLGDPLLARATMLMADGLYYESTTIGVPFHEELDVSGFLRGMIADRSANATRQPPPSHAGGQSASQS